MKNISFRFPFTTSSRTGLAVGAFLSLISLHSPAALVVSSASADLLVRAEVQGEGGAPIVFQNDSDLDATFGDGALALSANAFAEFPGFSTSTTVDTMAGVTFTPNLTVLNFIHHWIGLTTGSRSTVYSSRLGFDVQFQATEAGVLDVGYLLNRSGVGDLDGFDFTGVQISVVFPASSFGANNFGLGNQILADSRSFSLNAGQVMTISVDSGPNIGISSGPFGVNQNNTLNGQVTMAFTPAVPEPGACSLAGLGLAALLARRRRG